MGSTGRLRRHFESSRLPVNRGVMRFDKAALEALDENFTEEEKKYLLAKFFPESRPVPWKVALQKGWSDSERWQRYLEADVREPIGAPYRYPHHWLVQVAQANRPLVTGSSVTDFTGWLFSLYGPPKDPQVLAQGRNVERQLVRRYLLEPNRKGWTLEYEGIRSEGRQPKVISALTVGGAPLRAAPDFVFKEKATGRVVIVEIKASNREIPSDGWPNLRAQLWAYAHIDDWRDAPEIILVAEVWGFTSEKIVLRGTRRWKSNDDQLNRENIELFALYGGDIANPN